MMKKKQKKQQNKDYLAGIKIAHDLEDFEEGNEVILTLKDEQILADPAGTAINEGIDTLENIKMKETLEQQFKNKQKEEIKRGTANDYSQDKYDMEKKMLSKYDEKSAVKKGLVLDNTGNYNYVNIKKLEEIKNKFNKANSKVTDLNVTSKIALEYLTVKPKQQRFRKPKKKNPVEKRKAQSLIDFLEENVAEESLVNDHGTREGQQANIKKDLIEDNLQKKQKKDNYEAALNKAREDTYDQQKKFMKFALDEDDDDEEQQLQQSLEKQQRILQQRKKNIDNDKLIKDLVNSNQMLERENDKLNLKDYSQMIAEEQEESIDGKQKLTKIITGTEFLKNIKTDKEVQEGQIKILAPTPLSIKDTRGGTTSCVNVSLPSEKYLNYARHQEKIGYQSIYMQKAKQQKNDAAGLENEDNEQNDIDEEQELEKLLEDEDFLKEEMEFIAEEGLGTGLSGALKRMRESGQLQDNGNEYSGRARDKTPFEELKKFAPAKSDNIKLEYRDQNGKLMTPKEAFRHLCWTFHGKRPGKNKKDKRMGDVQSKRKQQYGKFGNQESAQMKALAKSQKKTNLPYLVLSQSKQN